MVRPTRAIETVSAPSDATRSSTRSCGPASGSCRAGHVSHEPRAFPASSKRRCAAANASAARPRSPARAVSTAVRASFSPAVSNVWLRITAYTGANVARTARAPTTHAERTTTRRTDRGAPSTPDTRIGAKPTHATAAEPRVGAAHGSRNSACTITVPISARATGSRRSSCSSTTVARSAAIPMTWSVNEPPAATTTAEPTMRLSPDAVVAAIATAAASVPVRR